MFYSINDRFLRMVLCGDDLKKFINKEKSKTAEFGYREFAHPLDDQITGITGLLSKLLIDDNGVFLYSEVEKLDALWIILIDKSVQCLRYFDNRDSFKGNDKNVIITYGIDVLEEYFRKYIDFEKEINDTSANYQEHVFHVVRVWMLGTYCLINKDKTERNCLYSQLHYDGEVDRNQGEWNFFECISMWTIAALCHDLGYPLEKAFTIMGCTKEMMKGFIPNLNKWDSFGYSGTQDNINNYILKYISSKMISKSYGNEANNMYVGRIQPKYYLKYAKSLENYNHGIISTVIVFKMLLFFLDVDFNLNDDSVYKKEDVKQFYVRREILRAMASHTCPDYIVHMYTLPGLLCLCDELQVWGRKTRHQFHLGINNNSVKISINQFDKNIIKISETIHMKNIEDVETLLDNVCHIIDHQDSFYDTKIRNGQNSVVRDFGLEESILLEYKHNRGTNNNIVIRYSLSKEGGSRFVVDTSDFHHEDKIGFIQRLKSILSNKFTDRSLDIIILPDY